MGLQLMELKIPMLLVLNMADSAKRRGFQIDLERFKNTLGLNAVMVIGHKNQGTGPLLSAIEVAINNLSQNPPHPQHERVNL